MDKTEAIKVLDDLRKNDVVVQRGRQRELNEAFKVFWEGCKDEDEFEKCCSGLLITPRLMYHMIANPPPKPGKPRPAEETKLPTGGLTAPTGTPEAAAAAAGIQERKGPILKDIKKK